MDDFRKTSTDAFAFGLLLVISLLLVYLAYRQGFSGGQYFDDEPNLMGLGDVESWQQAIAFISSGNGGPLGRPLSFLSFLINANAWPSAIPQILHTNTCIHLLNGGLVVWLAYRILNFFPDKIRAPHWLALLIGMLWAAQPLLASTSLMVIQRMTSLSAFFALGSMVVFVSGIGHLKNHPRRAYLRMTTATVIGTTLAILAKENGVLLPAFLLVLQAILIPVIFPQGAPAPFQLWRRVFLILPQVILVAYVAITLPKILDVYVIREFSVLDRLLTQPRALLDYLRLIALPDRTLLGPFHDDYPVSRSLFAPLSTLPSLLLIVGAGAAAFIYRKKYPLPAFGLIWFLVGHAIESNVFALENYFEHRNYLPAIGPIFAVCTYVWQIEGKWKTIARLSLATYSLLLGIILTATTTVWGNQSLAFNLWKQQHPDSERATQILANHLARSGNLPAGQAVIEELSRRRPSNVGLVLQRQYGACMSGRREDKPTELDGENGIRLLSTGFITPLVCSETTNLAQMVVEQRCGTLTVDDMHRITQYLLNNPIVGKQKEMTFCVHTAKANLYLAQNESEKSLYHLEQAAQTKQFVTLFVQLARISASIGQYERAMRYLDQGSQHLPANPVLRKSWQEQLSAARLELQRLMAPTK